MLKFRFFFEDIIEPLSGFDLGHCSVEGEGRSISSKDATRDQSFMLFISIVDLLDGVKGLILSPKTKEFVFAAAGSSFGLRFRRAQVSYVDVLYENQLVGTTSLEALASSLSKAASQFHTQYLSMLAHDDAVRSDFEPALMQFQQVVGSAD